MDQKIHTFIEGNFGFVLTNWIETLLTSKGVSLLENYYCTAFLSNEVEVEACRPIIQPHQHALNGLSHPGDRSYNQKRSKVFILRFKLN